LACRIGSVCGAFLTKLILHMKEEFLAALAAKSGTGA
jgi:hypothetical protein